MYHASDEKICQVAGNLVDLDKTIKFNSNNHSCIYSYIKHVLVVAMSIFKPFDMSIYNHVATVCLYINHLTIYV